MGKNAEQKWMHFKSTSISRRKWRYFPLTFSPFCSFIACLSFNAIMQFCIIPNKKPFLLLYRSCGVFADRLKAKSIFCFNPIIENMGQKLSRLPQCNAVFDTNAIIKIFRIQKIYARCHRAQIHANLITCVIKCPRLHESVRLTRAQLEFCIS